MPRIVRLSLVALAAAALVSPPGAGAAPATSYAAPFTVGPAGGDTYSRQSADPGGQVLVARAYPVPGPLSCPAGSPYASLRVLHPVNGAVSSVEADLTDVVVDPYVFVTLTVRDDKGGFRGTKDVRGPLTGDTTVRTPVAWPTDPKDAPKTLTIDVGLKGSSACPSLNAATITLSTVRVLTGPADPAPDPGTGASPAPPVQFLTAAQASLVGYATPAVVLPKGGSGGYSNADIVRHDVVQDVAVDGRSGPTTNPWCNRFAFGKCPMFWTPLIGVTEQVPVQGLSALAAGQYSFFCTLHPSMKGKLVVQ